MTTMFIGVDMGGTNLKGGLVDDEGKILCKDSLPTGDVANKEEMLQRIITLCRRLDGEAVARGGTVTGIGFGIPGTIDNLKGVAVYNPNIPGFRQVAVREHMRRQFRDGLRYEMANDADVAAFAEAAVGAAKGTRHSVSVTLGTGVGGGVVIDGRLYTGCNAVGIEIGHMCIERHGESCNCGRQGCFEAYSSATALIRQTRRAVAANPDSILAKLVGGDPEKVDGRTAFLAAGQGCPVGAAVVDTYIDYLAEGLVNIIVCFQPEVISIGGGVCNEGDNLMIPLGRRIEQKLYAAPLQRTRVVRALLGNDAGIIGAAMLCRP
jgi:glucokinase